jgi:uncharacterized membrane protein YidH (DUF202 family)
LRDSTYDRGLATERTHLSWNRTCLALGALAVLSLRLAVGEAIVAVLLAGVGVVASMLVLVHARRRYSQVSTIADPVAAAALTCLTVAFGAFVIVAVLAAA